jgi:tRNA pseudouridine13 synthase
VDFKLELPYITEQMPGVGGQLRTNTSDFVVEELPLYQPQDSGQHLYVNLTKEGLTTREVQVRLANLFRVSKGAVGFAGMKDKFARTTQTLSIDVGHVDEGFVTDAATRIQDHLPVTVHWARLHKNKLKPGHLIGNRFTITITDLAVPPDEALRRAEAVAAQLRARGLPNFFGPQRLGHEGGNVRRGYGLLQGQNTVRDRWLARFLLSSLQSYLCNLYLARRMEFGHFDCLLLGDVAKKYDTGGLFSVDDLTAEQPRYAACEISFTAPIYGHKMWAATGPAGRLEEDVLADAGIEMEQLQAARAGGTRRLGRLLLPDLQVRLSSTDLIAEFSLPKGAYATTVLAEFMKVGYAALANAPAEEEEE